MYLRLRKLNQVHLKTGDETLMLAVSQVKIGAISVRPCVLEWWDGLVWLPVKIVEEDNKDDPVP